MPEIDFVLTAKNDCQDLKLTLTEDKGEFWFTLWGTYRGEERFQVDFNELKRIELEELKVALELILEI